MDKKNTEPEHDTFQDSKGLGYRSNGRYAIGYVDEINGPGAEEMDGFRPTRYELKELVRLWYQKRLGHEIFFFLHAQSGSTEWRESVYADRRIDRIAEVIGVDAVGEIVQEVEEAEKNHLGEEHWQIFASGDRAAWEKVQMEVHAAYSQRPCGKTDNNTTW